VHNSYNTNFINVYCFDQLLTLVLLLSSSSEAIDVQVVDQVHCSGVRSLTRSAITAEIYSERLQAMLFIIHS
jgi:hypothetical protein